MAKKKIETKTWEFGDIFTPESFAKDNKISIEMARELIKDKLSQRRIMPLFRVNTTQLEFNPWTPELSKLSRDWELPDGSKIKGGRPENIEIAFMVCVEF